MHNGSFLSTLWVRYHRFLPHLRRTILLLAIALVIPFDVITYFSYNIGTINTVSFVSWETLQGISYILYIYIKDRRIGVVAFSVILIANFSLPGVQSLCACYHVYAIIFDLVAASKVKLSIVQMCAYVLAQYLSGIPFAPAAFWAIVWGMVCISIGILIRNTRERLEEMQREAERSKEVAAELIQQLRRDIADSLHDDLAADLTRMLIISRSISLPNGDDRDRLLDLQDRTQQALTHLRLLIHNLAISQGLPKEEPTLREIVDSSISTLSQREIILDADLDGIENIPALHRSEPGRLLVAFIRENILNALKYNAPHDLVSLFVEQEQDTLYISCSSPWREQKIPEEMHGGYGLLALQNRFENAGGTLSSNRIGASWTVLASLPWSELATPTTNARSLMSPPDGAIYA